MKKRIVAFICAHNSCRSQMAEALGNYLYGDQLECYSAGTVLKSHINRDAVRIIKDLYGIDMNANGQHSKLVDEIPTPDIAVSMGCDVSCPFIGRPFDDDWSLPDPTGKDDAVFRAVIVEIERKFKNAYQRIEWRSSTVALFITKRITVSHDDTFQNE